MLTYMNPHTGLFGYMPNIAEFSTGNTLLDTGTAYVILASIKEMTPADKMLMLASVLTCNSHENKWLASHPYSSDRISHDDMIGLVAGLYFTQHFDFISYLVDYGMKHRWVFSTTGEFYWDAWTKPWHKAYYILADNEMPWLGGRLMMSAYIVFDGLLNKRNMSDKKLIWLMYKVCSGKSAIVDLALGFWHSRLLKKFGSMQNVFITYYGQDHLFSKWCRE